MQPYILEIIALIVVVFSAMIGAKRGFLLSLYSFVKIVLMIALTVLLYPVVKEIVAKEFSWGTEPAVLIALIISVLALGLVARVLGIVNKIPVIRSLNKLGGGVLGAVFGIVIVSIAILVVCVCKDAKWCQEIYVTMRQSEYLMYLLNMLRQIGIPII